ncbi:hypothetical protein GCM10009789_63670 [Kribbella sancticallisti]|uniref:Uncharacterized protein n=1 Tax=Kribbella sancticallisti TaxID=460087 RepID=A0ABN2EBD5_9ACTN
MAAADAVLVVAGDWRSAVPSTAAPAAARAADRNRVRGNLMRASFLAWGRGRARQESLRGSLL